MLLSETHLTYQHPDNTAHGCTAIIIRDSIKHHEREKYAKDYLKVTRVTVDNSLSPITISAVHCPLKHNNKKNHFNQFSHIGQ